MAYLPEDLVTCYRSRRLILFAGAGISMNLGLPSWRELIDGLAKELGYDNDVFQTYGNDPDLAEYYLLRKGSLGELRSRMDTLWHQDIETKVRQSALLQQIAEMRFPLYYTTNYDRAIETALQQNGSAFTPVRNARDMANIRSDGKQVVKFHGDFTDDTSIVLTESSYFERLDFESPLDIKFRSDILHNGVLFIGYSLRDINLRFIFYKLSKLRHNTVHGTRLPIYVFTHRPNPVQQTVLDAWGIRMIVGDDLDPGNALLNFLRSLEKRASSAC